MLGKWLTAGHLDRQIERNEVRGQVVLGAQLAPSR